MCSNILLSDCACYNLLIIVTAVNTAVYFQIEEIFISNRGKPKAKKLIKRFHVRRLAWKGQCEEQAGEFACCAPRRLGIPFLSG